MTQEIKREVLVLPPGGGKPLRFGTVREAMSHPRVPAGSKVWTGPRQFADNAGHRTWVPYLKDIHPELCDPALGTKRYEGRFITERVYPALLALAETPAGAAPTGASMEENEGETEMATKSKKKSGKAAKAKRTARAGNGASRTRTPKDGKIVVLVDKNPRREGTKDHEQFALMKNGMLVSTFLDKGGKMSALSYEKRKGTIKVEAPAA